MEIKYSITLILILLGIHMNAQKKDMIVTAEGDSILCNIDCTDTAYIYFEMIKDYKTVKTKINQNKIKTYDENSYRNNDFRFERGSSVIKGTYLSMKDINKNCIYYSTTILTNSLHYERLIPIGNYFSTGLSAGFDFMFSTEKTVSVFEINFSLPGPKNNFEFGPSIYSYLGDFKSAVYSFRAGYKYLGPNGFLFRIYPMIVKSESYLLPNFVPWMGISLGYNF